VAVGARELMLILRARDEASRVLQGARRDINHMSEASRKAAQKHIDQGKSLVAVGAGIAVVGAQALSWLNDATTAAGDYNTQVRYTKTQTDQVQVSLSELSDIGLELARTIPVPFEEIQKGLYDIFSSMDVSVPQAKRLLTEFSKAAVAGQTDLATAAKGSIAIMNAWKLPATEVNRVNDVMFRLVQKGVGTYGDFSKAIGRAIPSTVRAGGSIEDLAGMMAFMTRNGLSTAQAATSAGRAFDAMSNPATEKHMNEIGLSVRNAKGEFKPMVQVIEEMQGKLGKMTAPERAKAMKALFLGSGGTIQARRFFDLAIPGFKELRQRTDEMHDSAGTMEEAYKTMFDSPQAQMQLMQNKYQAMRVELGNNLLPVKMKLVEAVMKLLDAWAQLSPETQRYIAIGAAVTAVLMILVGVLVIAVGGILMLMGAAALAGVSLGAVFVVVGLVIAAIVALAVAIWQVVTNWDSITEWFSNLWEDIKKLVSTAVANIRNRLATFGIAFVNFWIQLSARVMIAIANFPGNLFAWMGNIRDGMLARVASFAEAFRNFFSRLPGRTMSAINSLRSMLVTFMNTAGSAARQAMMNRLVALVTYVRGIPGRIRNAMGNPGGLLVGIGRAIISGLINGVRSMIGSLQNQFSNITNMIPDWKGPADVDKKLLYGAGQLTMQGYQEGIEDGVPGVKNTLQGLTARVPSMVGVGQGAGGGATQNFYITTQEIDPRKHAADLGVMVASRLG
jgi:TP901 family phage tail tape measure protein